MLGCLWFEIEIKSTKLTRSQYHITHLTVITISLKILTFLYFNERYWIVTSQNSTGQQPKNKRN